ncbi:ADP-ribosylation factor-like protein 2-binding protein isoform X4 [Polyodon spathula]|uniref:ADP-ribosylation factor-like protein 2-binding protein isoform X4 n=1 Tax=Polyodon spathula TaxID=7913 RepID=UPI001B7E3D2F|nr:ADP-ribosylation factor-like protein 2-binding protein isoform X4 [Polyodon spathula]
MAARERILFGDNAVEMESIEEEDFAISNSSDADAAFDAVVGYIEDIMMVSFNWAGDEFQQLQRNFMEKHYLEFEDSEENKLSYTPIFNEHIDLLEKYIEQQLTERMPGFSMSAFTTSLQSDPLHLLSMDSPFPHDLIEFEILCRFRAKTA